MHADWFKISIVLKTLNTCTCRNAELAQSGDIHCNDGASKGNLHFDDQSRNIVFLLFGREFSKRNSKRVARVSMKSCKGLDESHS